MDQELEKLHSQGFSILVSLLDENEQLTRYDPNRAQTLGYVRHTIPVRDFHVPTIAQVCEFTRLVESAPPGSKLLIHCEGGTGRTGTMAAAYWIAKGLTSDAAIERVRKTRLGAVETLEQKAILCDFASQLGRVRTERNSA
jgi:atypical dual specificity phosphatase